MPHLILLTFIISIVSAEKTRIICDGFQANFNIKQIIGEWHVVAVIPEKLFPEKQIACFNVEFSETDEASLRWLVNKTQPHQKLNLVEDLKTPIVRQRYHSENPFDIWSKTVEGVKGCFQQVLSLDTDKSDIYKAVNSDAVMQLHLLDAGDRSGPILMQMLWGKLIAAVIYRKDQDITEDQLKLPFELLSKLRGPQRLPKTCDTKTKDLHVLQ